MSEPVLRLVSEGGPRSEPREDQELLARVARGDRAAFEKLYGRYHLRIGRFLYRFTANRELIDEIVNDTMFTVWRKASAFRGDSRASTWILGIAYRRALRALRSASRAAPPGTTLPAESVEAELTSDDLAGAREQREWIDRGLAELPFPQRIVIELAYFLGLSCEEIAVIVDCPVNTVKTRMFNARARLRPVLARLSGAEHSPVSPARSTP
jgi:RNA polymerase sigma-70 factor, ECF subfamily